MQMNLMNKIKKFCYIHFLEVICYWPTILGLGSVQGKKAKEIRQRIYAV